MREFVKRLFHAPEAFALGNSLVDWLSAGIVAVFTWAALWAVRGLVASRRRKYMSDDRPTAVRLIAYLAGKTKYFLIWAVSLYAAEPLLDLPPKVARISANIVLILILLQAGIWASHAVRFYLENKQRTSGEVDSSFVGSIDIIAFVARLVIWALVLLVALANLGVNITALLAGLGVGGVAVALALQNILGDLFASLSIALDKPFRLGDSLSIDDCQGTVEHIGIKSTRLRSVSGEQIILSNADILKSRVRNFGRAAERRALLALGVPCDTPSDKLQMIPALLERIVNQQPTARFDRCHFTTIGASSLQFELAYRSAHPTLEALLDVQQAINLKIIEEFRAAGIELAYPTQRILGLPGRPALNA